MAPLIPYNGMLRPTIMLAAIVLDAVVLQRMRDKPYRRRVEFASLLLYVLLLAYATFLSRTVTEVYSYRLSVMNSARQAFALDGNLWELIKGDFSLLRISDLRSLEGIVINILLFIPLGFLITRIWSLRWWQVMLIGMFTSAAIELLQLVTKLGMLDVDAWIFNTLGTSLGIVLQHLIMRAEAHKQKRRNTHESRYCS